MNISAISVTSGLPVQKSQNKMNFASTKGQMAVDIFNKGKDLRIEEDIVASLKKILEIQDKAGRKIDTGFKAFVEDRSSALVKSRADYLKANNEYIRNYGEMPSSIVDLRI